MNARAQGGSPIARARGNGAAGGRTPLYLVDDPSDAFRPLSWTRPVCELLCGAETFRERIERLLGRPVAGTFAPGRFESLSFTRLGGSPLTVGPRHPAAGPLVLLDALYVPPPEGRPVFTECAHSARFWLNGKMVGAWLEESEVGGALETINARGDWREAARRGEDVELPGRRPAALHRLIARNAEQIVADLGDDLARPEELDAVSGVLAGERREHAGLHLEGPAGRLRVALDAELAAPVYVDVREGPVRIDSGVRVEPFTMLRGPLVVREGASLLGGEIGPGCTIGPRCKVRGEVQGSIFLGFSNKAHEGFVGDSYVGEWVNLGAGTMTSNLKNNYGYVRLRQANEVVETGLMKLGSLIGDHVKTGIGTLLPTGAIIGPGSNLYGSLGFAPQFLPAFSWGAGTRQETHRLEAFLESARRAMERRGTVLEPEEAGMLGAVFRATESERIAV